MDFNTFWKMYKEWQNKPHMFVVNNVKMKHMRVAYDKLKNVIHKYSPDAKIEIEINKFNDGSAYIAAETDEMIVKDVHEFFAIIEYASNFEVYPLKNGNIKIAIMFDDIMTPVR